MQNRRRAILALVLAVVATMGSTMAGITLSGRQAGVWAAKNAVRQSFQRFFMTSEPAKPYRYGRHTMAMMQACQEATEAVERGECYYARVHVPVRHGKSDVASRRYPAWHLGRNPDHEIILASYGARMAIDLSIDARRCFERMGPWAFGKQIGRQRGESWGVAGHKGMLNAVGLTGGIQGVGANILIIDDYCKGRAAAESVTVRNSTWEAFTNDLMGRLAPVHAILIPSTRWHEDDLAGRIKQRNNLDGDRYDPDFPQFREVRFPAQADDGSWLFPERFSEAWYRMHKAGGAYKWASLFQNDPAPRGGNLLKVAHVRIIDKMPSGLQWFRGWDLASTEAERMGDDPDWTVGIKAAVSNGKLFIADEARIRAEAPERNAFIEQTALCDGPSVGQRVECVAGYKDAYTTVKRLLKGKNVVTPVVVTTDKFSRMSIFEPTYEAKQVYLLRAPWNKDHLAEVGAFPSGKHDDRPDALHAAVGHLIEEHATFGIERL